MLIWCLGGVTYYWQLLNPEKSLAQNIDLLCFNENGQLHNEYQTLFRSLFSSNRKHREIIEALLKKGCGMQRVEFASIKNIGDGKSLTGALEELCECGFIRAYDNYKTNKSGKFYQVIDPFVLFSKTFLITTKFDSWVSYINTPSYYSWTGHTFKILCLNNINAIKKALGISGVMTKEYSWKSKKSNPGAQIDLLIQRKDMIIDICEMKYTIGEFSINESYQQNLRNKLQTFINEVNPKEQLQLTMITMNGFKENEYSSDIISKIDGKNLF